MLPTPVFIVCFLDREKRQDDEEQTERKIITPPGGVLPTLFNEEKKQKIRLFFWIQRLPLTSVFHFNFFQKNVSHFQRVSYIIHEIQKLLFSIKISLKIRHTISFIYLKIILLQYFQFSIFSYHVLHKN